MDLYEEELLGEEIEEDWEEEEINWEGEGGAILEEEDLEDWDNIDHIEDYEFLED